MQYVFEHAKISHKKFVTNLTLKNWKSGMSEVDNLEYLIHKLGIMN